MKAQLFIPVTLLVSVALVPLMKIRKMEQMAEDKRSIIMDIKLRVTGDVLLEYKNEMEAADGLVAEKTALIKELDTQLSTIRSKRDETQNGAETCNGLKKFAVDELATTEMALNILQALNEKEKADWEKQVATLRSDLATQSSLCDLLRTDAQGISMFCKQEPPKAEAPKQEEPEPEAPKQEEPEPEEPEPEEPEPEEPKPEEPKPEAPNPEEPKPEEFKPEPPNPEEPKPEAPNPEEFKPEPPNPEEPKPEVPKPEDPKNRSLK